MGDLNGASSLGGGGFVRRGKKAVRPGKRSITVTKASLLCFFIRTGEENNYKRAARRRSERHLRHFQRVAPFRAFHWLMDAGLPQNKPLRDLPKNAINGGKHWRRFQAEENRQSNSNPAAGVELVLCFVFFLPDFLGNSLSLVGKQTNSKKKRSEPTKRIAS